MRTGDVGMAFALAAFVLAGCSRDHAGSLPPPSPTTRTPSPTASTVPQPPPRVAAQRALAAYIEALNDALHDPARRRDALADVLEPRCGCRAVLDVIDDERRAARHFDYAYSVRDVVVVAAGSLGASLTFTAEQSAGHERRDDGSIVRSFPAQTIRFSAHFVVADGRWLLDRLDQVR